MVHTSVFVFHQFLLFIIAFLHFLWIYTVIPFKNSLTLLIHFPYFFLPNKAVRSLHATLLIPFPHLEIYMYSHSWCDPQFSFYVVLFLSNKFFRRIFKCPNIWRLLGLCPQSGNMVCMKFTNWYLLRCVLGS